MGTSNKLVVKDPSPSRRVPLEGQYREVLQVGALNQWHFDVWGVSPPPTHSVYFKNYWLVPLAEEQGQMPAAALARVAAIYDAGIKPKAFIFAHEAPATLKAPPPPPAPTFSERVDQFRPYAQKLASHSGKAMQVTGKVLSDYVFPATVTGMQVLGGLLAAVAFTAILIDPALICVTSDDLVWVKIYAWKT